MRPPREFQSSQQKKSRRPSIDQKRGKAGDSSGIRAEHIENCDSETKEWIRQIFNEIVQQEDCTPQTWRRIRIKVIHKNGDVEDAGNYRPMCSLPVLYKLFATALHARLAPKLDKCHPAVTSNCRPLDGVQDAGAALPRMGCTTVHLDARLHEGLWTSLEHYGIGPLYIGLLKRLYSQQEGSVMTDKESTVFQIKRGTKQGDPVSSLLFNTVLQHALENDLKKWQQKKNKGIRLSDKIETA